jgi:hypothetical protein
MYLSVHLRTFFMQLEMEPSHTSDLTLRDKYLHIVMPAWYFFKNV